MTTISSLSSADIQSQLSIDESRMQAPITALDNQITTDKADISAWSAIKGKVSSLSSALSGISDLSSLTSRAASTTSSSIATATATNSAAVGTYNITDVTLAKAQIVYSGFIASGAKLGASAGSLQFVQNGKTISIHLGSGSLTASGAATAINKADGGVEASVVKSSVNSTAGAYLVLQSSATGSSQSFKVAGTGGLSHFSYSASAELFTSSATATATTSQSIYYGVASNSTTLGSQAGTLNFKFAGASASKTVAIGSGSLTASGVVSAINAQSGSLGVTASLVSTDGAEHLVLKSAATGASQAFSVSGTGGLSRFSYSPSAELLTATSTARNANLDINGIPVSHSTNTISSAVTGLTINLAASSETGTTIKVSNSSAGVAAAVSNVATTLNAAIAGITTEIKYTPATKSASASGSTAATAGPLIGNFIATNLESQLLQAVSGAEASGLSADSIGFSVSSAGTISFTSSTFESAYKSNPTAVEKLVSSIYTTLSEITTGALGSTDNSSGGALGTQITSLDSTITSINSQIATITKDNNVALQILVKEYAVAESAANNASITEQYLSLITNASSSSSGS
jgi:flagellar hook-associated protein 2